MDLSGQNRFLCFFFNTSDFYSICNFRSFVELKFVSNENIVYKKLNKIYKRDLCSCEKNPIIRKEFSILYKEES